jgi:hypothetical protein
MVDENMVSRTVKALATMHGPRIRDTKWVAGFSGLREDQVVTTLNWLLLRKLVMKKAGGFKLSQDARKFVVELINSRCSNFVGFLDEGYKPEVAEEKSKNPLARRLHRLYYEHLAPRGSKFEFYRKGIPAWKTQPTSVKLAFRRAAQTCEELKAEPQQFVEAQFLKFDRLSIRARRPLLPQPAHLAGPSAVTSYLEFQSELDDRKLRRTVKAAHSNFEIELDKLASLALFHQCSEMRVLLKLPQEFTREFLRHKGVWANVKHRFIAASGDLAI